jgi:hypothetical protein
MRWMNPTLSALALATLTACANVQADSTIAAADSDPLAMTGLMVLSQDGRRMLGTVESVATGPDGRPTSVVIASRPPAFPLGDHITVAADDLQVSPERSAAILTGMTVGEYAERLSEGGMVALSGAPCPTCARAPTNWSGVR